MKTPFINAFLDEHPSWNLATSYCRYGGNQYIFLVPNLKRDEDLTPNYKAPSYQNEFNNILNAPDIQWYEFHRYLSYEGDWLPIAHEADFSKALILLELKMAKWSTNQNVTCDDVIKAYNRVIEISTDDYTISRNIELEKKFKKRLLLQPLK